MFVICIFTLSDKLWFYISFMSFFIHYSLLMAFYNITVGVNGLLSAYVLLDYFLTLSLTCNLHFISFCRSSSHFLHNWSCLFQLFCLRFRRSRNRTGRERWHCVHSQCYSWPQSTWQSTVWRARSAGRQVLYCLFLRSIIIIIIITTAAIVQTFYVHNHYFSIISHFQVF